MICEKLNKLQPLRHRRVLKKRWTNIRKQKGIYIIFDNAGYYRNKALMEWIRNTAIKQIFLFPHFPDFNLIERFWIFLRKKVIYTGFYRIKELFCKAICDFFENIEQYKSELEAVLTLNFRLIGLQFFSF